MEYCTPVTPMGLTLAMSYHLIVRDTVHVSLIVRGTVHVSLIVRGTVHLSLTWPRCVLSFDCKDYCTPFTHLGLLSVSDSQTWNGSRSNSQHLTQYSLQRAPCLPRTSAAAATSSPATTWCKFGAVVGGGC